ncbi:UNVERIFIED_CONTAM: hypothetical protein FKN15_071170 [Acipenser sinensis]
MPEAAGRGRQSCDVGLPVMAVTRRGAGEKKLSKKEKVKQRREKWLNKIDTIKLDREKQKALAKRKATPVVGDMQALADALPDLAELLAASKIRLLKKLKTPQMALWVRGLLASDGKTKPRRIPELHPDRRYPHGPSLRPTLAAPSGY